MRKLSSGRVGSVEKAIATFLSVLLVVTLIPVGAQAFADNSGEVAGASEGATAAGVGGDVSTSQTEPVQQTEPSVVTGFAEHAYTDAVDQEIHYLEVGLGTPLGDIDFPKTVKGTLAGGELDGYTLDVLEWVTSSNPGFDAVYDADTLGAYYFEPVLALGEDLTLGQGVVLPRLEIVVSDVPGFRVKPGMTDLGNGSGVDGAGGERDAGDSSGLRVKPAMTDLGNGSGSGESGVFITPLLDNSFGLLAAGDVHIVVVLDAEGGNLTTLTVFDGELAQEPEAPALPVGANAFIGWFETSYLSGLTGGAKPDVDKRFDFAQPITKNYELKPAFSADYLVQIINEFGMVKEAYVKASGQTLQLPYVTPPYAPPVGEAFTGKYFEMNKTGNSYTKGQEFVLSTSINKNYVLQAESATAYQVYFVTNGSPVATQTVFAGGQATTPAAPTRSGYSFARWSTTEGGAAYNFTTPVQTGTTLFAVWTPQKVGFRITYWLEKANIIGDPGTNPDNYELAYATTVANTDPFAQYAGTLMDAATLQSLAAANYDDAKAANYAMPYAEYNYASNSVVAGSENTNINLYYKRIVYTLIFDMRANPTDLGFTDTGIFYYETAYIYKNGIYYQKDSTENPYTLNVKYEQYVVDLWPKPEEYHTGSTGAAANYKGYGAGYYFYDEPPNLILGNGGSLATFGPNATTVMEAQNRRTCVVKVSFRSANVYKVVTYLKSTNAELSEIAANNITVKNYNDASLRNPDGNVPTYVKYNNTTYTFQLDSVRYADYNAAGWGKTGYAFTGYARDNSSLVQNYATGFYLSFNFAAPDTALTYNLQVDPSPGTIGGSSAAVTSNLNVDTPIASYVSTPTPQGTDRFIGWYWDADFKVPYLGNELKHTKPEYLYAKYESTDQTVTFRDTQGGNVVATAGTSTGGQVGNPEVYANGQAYQGLGTFLGWYTQQGTNIIPFGFETNIYADTEVFAVWRTDNFTITYDLDDGTGATAPTDSRLYDMTSNTLTNVLAPVGGTPTKTVEGITLTFVGWTANGVSYFPGQYLTPYGDTRMVARYVPAGQIRNLIFNPNGGTVVGGGNSAQWSVQSGDRVLLPTEVDLGFSKVGYKIIGWATNGAASAPDSGYATGSSVAVTTNTTLYAVWAPKNVAISYHRNDGSANDGYSTGAVPVGVYGAPITNAPTVPTRTGYILDGWYTAASAGTKWNFDGTPTALTVANGVVENPSTGNETLELFAHWTLKNYTVNINPNHDSLAVVAQSGKQLGGSVDLTRLTRTHWTLLGYATSASATTASYTQTSVTLTENAILSLFSNDTANAVTLYAVWREDPKFTVTYNSGTGGSGTVTDTGGNAPSGTNNYYTGSTVTVKQSTGFSRANYHFTGWATASATGPVVYTWNGSAFSPATFNITANTTLYAVWAINSNAYTVNVASGSAGHGNVATGGSYTASGSSVNVGAAVNYSATADAGYRFANWTVTGSGVTLSPNANTATGSFSMPDNAVTLQANFAANTVTVNTKSGGSDFSGHGTITLGTDASGTISATSDGNTANVVFAGVPNGTYHIFDGTKDTGFSVVVNNNDPIEVVNYVTYSVTQSGGVDGVKTSTGITLTFSSVVTGLATDNITLSNGTGAATKGAFSGSGTSYTVAVSGVSRGTVEVAVSSPSGVFVSNSPQNVTVYKDTTAPTAQVQYRTSALREFLNTISFGYWFKDTVDVAITSTDGSGDGLADSGGVKYYLATAEITGDAAAVSTAIDNSGTSGTSFTQAPDGKFILYVKVTDKNGNYSIYKDGLVVYTDTTGAAVAGEFVKNVTGNVDITGLNFQGNTVRSVRNVTSSAAVPSDASGYTTGTNTVTVTSNYLNTLTAGSYNFEVEFYPQGATDAAAVINGATDTPAKSTFTIKVLDSKTVVSVAQFGGQNGKVRSTGILVTFNSAVTAPPANAFAVVGTSASTAPSIWTVTDGGDTDDKTWALVFTGGSWANGATDFTVATSSWGNYEISDTSAKAVAAMYVQVELGFTPAIDYVNETITGLESGRTYNFKYGSVNSSFVASGTTKAIDAAWFGESDFQILAVAAAGDNYVNSAFKPLAIAARPAAPSLTVSSHQTSGSGVEGEIGGVSTTMQYALSGSGTWTDCPGTTISGLAPGIYNVRVKATSTTFKSLSSTVEIHSYDTIGFGPVYEGYTLSSTGDTLAKNIHNELLASDPGAGGFDITDVDFEDASNVNNSAFTLTNKQNNSSTIGPVVGLAPGQYDTTLDVERSSYITGIMKPNVDFTVNGFMAFADTNPVVVNGSDAAASSTLTVNFLNPVAGLTAGDFNISGGAVKASTPNLTPVGPGDATNGYKSYTIAIEPTNMTTNDLTQISVEVTLPTVTLNGLTDIYAVQRDEYNITAITDTSAQVRVPRKVDTTDQLVYNLAGHDSGFLQFTLLDGAYFPISEPVGSGEISIVPYGGSATVDRVARVDASAVLDWGYTTYNVYLTNVTAGSVGIAFNNFVVQDANSLRYTLVNGAGATGTRGYFIEPDGGSAYKNILTDAGTGAQGPIFVDATGGATVAPETELLTSVDLDSTPTVQSVLLDGVALDSDLWQVSAGSPLSYSYDGSAPVTVNQPLVLTLKEGFTNTDGIYRLEVVLSPGSGYLYGLLDVSGISASMGLELANADARDLGGLTNHTFASLPFNYVAGDLTALDVSVLNTGNQATGDLSATLSGTNASSFELVQNASVVTTAAISSIANLGSADGVFSMRPKTGLVKGATYTATVSVGAATGNSTGIGSASFDVSFAVSNTAPGVASGQGTQSGTAAPASYNGDVAAVPYSVNLSTADWFSDVDSADTLTYSMVSEDADGTVGIDSVTSVLTFTPTVADAGLSRTIVIKANDGTADSGNVTITVAVAKAVPSVTLTAPGKTYGQSLTMTATVGYVGGATPTGTVSFYDGATVLAENVAVTNGIAEFSTTALAGGSHNLEARYSGDAVYLGYAANATIKGTATTSVSLAGQTIAMNNPGNKTYGDSAFGLSLSSAGAGSGMVSYVSDDEDVLTINGTTATIVGVGLVTITATKAADGNYGSATDSVTITVGQKELTVNVVVAGKPYDGTKTAATPAFNPAPSLVGVIGSDDVTLTNGIPEFDTVGAADTTNSIAINFTTDFSISGAKSGNYTLTQPTGITADITQGFAPVKGTHYSITALAGASNDVKWTGGAFVVAPMLGYQISTSSAYSGDFAGTPNLTSLADETTSGQTTFYIRDISSGAISRLGTETYKIDATVPTATVSYKDKPFTAFLNQITNGRFFEATVKVEILGADAGSAVGANSGLAKVEHFTTDQSFADTAAAEAFGLAISSWQDGASFNITAAEKGKLHVFAKVTDYAGNFSIYYDGLLVYENSVQTGISASYTKTTLTDVTVDATLKGNALAGIVNTTGSDAVLDAGDFTYSLTGGTGGLGSITVSGAYLDTLDAGTTYSFVVSYKPMGEAFTAVEPGSDTPATTTFTIAVHKQSQSSSLAVTGLNSPYIYGDAAVSVGASGGDGPGALSFEIVEASGAGVATLSGATVSGATLNLLKPGTFKVKATKAGDGSYEPLTVTSGVVEVLLAVPQVTLSASGTGVYGGDVNLAASVISRGVGVVPTGSVSFYVDGVRVGNPVVLDVSGKANCAVPMLGAGGHDFEVRYLGNAYYKGYGAVGSATVDPLALGTAEFNIGKAGQTIVLANPGNKTWGDADFTLSLSANGAGSGAVAYSALPAGVLAITGDSASIVGTGSVTITATKAADADHNGATSSVTIVVGKATIPAWTVVASGAGITYGKTLADSALSGWVVNGVGTHSGDVVSGTVAWKAPLYLPDVTTVSGTPTGYAVTFTPTGDDAKHYLALDGMADVTVGKAMPLIKTPLSGTPIRLAQILNDSVITGGTTHFGYGTQFLDIPGMWAWDNPTHGGTFYGTTGTKTEAASFTPLDGERFNGIQANIDLVVFSPTTFVVTPPKVTSLTYGDKLSNSGILAAGSLVNAVDDTPPATAIAGTWSWSNPDDRATSVGLDAYTAELTFTPAHLQANPANPVLGGGYVPTTVDVQITVGPAAPKLTLVSPGAVLFGKPLKDSDLSIYTVQGVFGETMTGKLEWKTPDVVPSDVLGEVGIYKAKAVFTPLGTFVPLYTNKEFDVDVLVVADTEALDNLSENIVTPLLPALHEENYLGTEIDALAAALDYANTVRTTVGVTQAAVDADYAELLAMYDALEHDHPVLEHSAGFMPITDTSSGFMVRFKGYFGSVEPSLGVVLDDEELVHTPTAEAGVHELSKGGELVGTLSEGSARVTLTPEFLGTLADGVHTLVVNFADGFRTGSGVTTLQIGETVVDDGLGAGDGSGTPKTGDDLMPLLWVVLLVTAGLTTLTWSQAIKTRRRGVHRR